MVHNFLKFQEFQELIKNKLIIILPLNIFIYLFRFRSVVSNQNNTFQEAKVQRSEQRELIRTNKAKTLVIKSSY